MCGEQLPPQPAHVISAHTCNSCAASAEIVPTATFVQLNLTARYALLFALLRWNIRVFVKPFLLSYPDHLSARIVHTQTPSSLSLTSRSKQNPGRGQVTLTLLFFCGLLVFFRTLLIQERAMNVPLPSHSLTNQHQNN